MRSVKTSVTIAKEPEFRSETTTR